MDLDYPMGLVASYSLLSCNEFENNAGRGKVRCPFAFPVTLFGNERLPLVPNRIPPMFVSTSLSLVLPTLFYILTDDADP